MPRISDKGKAMPPSPIRKLVPYAVAAQQRGLKVYALNIGQPDLPTPPAFWDKLHNMDMEVLAYSPSDGLAAYKRKWVEYYGRLGAELHDEDVLITTGASEALAIGMQCCLDAGDEIIIPEPLYANYIGFATAGGAVIRPVSTRIDDCFALPPMDSLAQLIWPRTKAILICNPNNPTGYLYTRDELEILRQLVLRYDLFLFADEVYREFAYDGREHISVLTLEGLEQNALVFDSVSKRFSACGARVGALISRNREVMDTAMKFAQARLSPPSLGQVAGEALFDLPPSYYADIVSEYDKRRRYMVGRLQAMEGVRCPMPGGAFYCIVELPVDDTDRFCRWMLESFEHEGSTVLMAPGSGFYASEDEGRNQARLAYVLKEEDLEAAMDCLEAGLAAYPHRVERKAGQTAH
jgi:aspartate aminotransferase